MFEFADAVEDAGIHLLARKFRARLFRSIIPHDGRILVKNLSHVLTTSYLAISTLSTQFNDHSNTPVGAVTPVTDNRQVVRSTT